MKKHKRILAWGVKGQRGDTLPFALLAMALGTLLLSPLMAHVSTSHKTVDQSRTTLHSHYTGDAGVEYAIYKLGADEVFRQSLIDNQGTSQELSMEGLTINDDTPTVEVVCVSSQSSGGEGGEGGEGGCTEPLQWALWANSASANHTIQTTGAGHTINGGVHSNHRIFISGSGHTINGDVRYVTSLSMEGAGNTINGTITDIDDPLPFPITWDIDWFRPGGEQAEAAAAEGKYHVHTANWNFGGAGAVIPEGLHYCTNKASLEGSGLIGENVTIVSEDTIDISGSGIVFDPYVSGLTFFSNKTSTNNVVSISGSGNAGGTAFAPNGKISLSGAGGAITGAFLGDRVAISGSGATINLAEVCLPPSGGGEGGEFTYAIYDIRSTSGSIVTTVRVREKEEGGLEILSWQVD